MIKTQIQLPDELYRAAKDLAARKEWSLAEVVRRGLEQVLCMFPGDRATGEKWELPTPHPLGADKFFNNPDWRFLAHHPEFSINEARSSYGTVKSKPGRKP